MSEHQAIPVAEDDKLYLQVDHMGERLMLWVKIDEVQMVVRDEIVVPKLQARIAELETQLELPRWQDRLVIARLEADRDEARRIAVDLWFDDITKADTKKIESWREEQTDETTD